MYSARLPRRLIDGTRFCGSAARVKSVGSKGCALIGRSKSVLLMFMKTSAALGFDDVPDLKAMDGLYPRSMTIARLARRTRVMAYTRYMSPTMQPSTKPLRLLAEQALSRAAGAPLLGGNALELLIDAPAHFDAWLKEIRGAQRRVLLENYIIRDDEVGGAFRDALVERARAGVMVAVIVDWLGCLGQSRRAFWAPLRAAGG